MTNYDRIKNMSIDEMAEWLDKTTSCTYCCARQICDNGNYVGAMCYKAFKKWLESEVEQ